MTPLRIPPAYNLTQMPIARHVAWLLGCLFITFSCVIYSAPVSHQMNTWQHPFDYSSETISVHHTSINNANKSWHLCALYPHLKDPYWLGVNYGMVKEAQRLGIKLTIYEAGGYPQIQNQLRQISQCVNNQADAIIIGAVSFSGLEQTVKQAAKRTPIIAAVNDMSNPGISAKVGVSWYTMGKKVGQYLADQHPQGSEPVNIAWFPGPTGAGWVNFIDGGFRKGIENSSVNIVSIKWGDTGKEIQRNLLQEVLNSNIDIDYIVGTALTAEAAVGELLNKGLRGKIQIVSTYMTQNVLRGIKRGHILAAPNDAPVLQGQLAVEQAVRLLQQNLTHTHIGPDIQLINVDNVADFNPDSVLPPPTYWPTFIVPTKE